MPIKNTHPLRKERTKADFKLFPLSATKRGTRAIQARNSRSNDGKDRMSSGAEKRANNVFFIPFKGV